MAAHFTDDDIRERIAEYKLALGGETQASVAVRGMWKKLVIMLEELLTRRAAERRHPNDQG